MNIYMVSTFWLDNPSILLNKNVSCSPCNKNICYNYENPLLCIHEITKSDVNYAIKSLHLDS